MYTLDTIIELVKDRFPNKLPRSIEVSLDEIRVRQGNQQVIEYLEGLKITEEGRRRAS
jgi:hypothetical protein